MAFVQIDPIPLLSEVEIARRVHAVSLDRGLDEFATVLGLMGIRQESNFRNPWNRKDPSSEKYPHDSESNDGRSVGYLQQQNRDAAEVPAPADDWWGPMSSRMNLESAVGKFFDRLEDNYGDALGNPALASEKISNVQRPRPDLRGEYGKHYDYCWGLLRRALADQITPPIPVDTNVKPVPGVQPNPGFRGDPLWLPSVLRAFGLDVTTFDVGVPWDQRGHGDFAVIDYVVWHHTGSVNETDNGIANHPSLGLAANMLIHPDGRVVLTGSGIAWHAGDGVWPGVARGAMNDRSIGIECAYGPDPAGQYTLRWPDKQIIAMVAVGAAISWFLGATLPIKNQIAHKEWAGKDNPLGVNAQGKPDPGNLDMGWFRGEIAKRLKDGPTGVAAIGGKLPDPPKPVDPPPVPPFDPTPANPAFETMAQVRGRWGRLGQNDDGSNRTLIEAIGHICDHIDEVDNSGNNEFSW